MTSRNVLVDGNNLLHRAQAVHVAGRTEDPLSSPSGYPTGLVYGFLSMLTDWVETIADPDYMGVFFDGVPKRRLAMDPDYKKKDDPDAKRPGSDPAPVVLSDGHEARDELDVIRHVLLLSGVDVYHNPSEESDDLIASYVCGKPDDVHIIISSDRDFYQLFPACPSLVIYRPGVSGDRFFDSDRAAEDMQKKYGCRVNPTHIRMLKALTGDPSDRIPGVPRLRKKVAAPLCGHQDVDSLLSTGLPGFSKRERDLTVSMRDRVALNLSLVELRRDLDVESCRTRGVPSHDLAREVLQGLGIRTVSTSAFKFSTHGTRRKGAQTPYDLLPDFLQDI